MPILFYLAEGDASLHLVTPVMKYIFFQNQEILSSSIQLDTFESAELALVP
jgi:hypothetical protein